MTLSPTVLNYLHDRARDILTQNPGPDDNLYNSGILDSFEIMHLISVLESEYHIDIPDSSVDPENFQTITAIETYVGSMTSL